MTQSKKIAITGGIGSGKSALCGVLRGLGYAVFSCDEISAQLWKDAQYLKSLSAAFPDCCTADGIDRKKLTEKVFSDGAARRRLNALAHPQIMQKLFNEMAAHAVSFAEVPLLYEEGLEGAFDGVIALRRPLEQRVASVRARDGLNDGEIARRMAAQLDAAELDKKQCFLLENDGRMQTLERGAREALLYFGIA